MKGTSLSIAQFMNTDHRKHVQTHHSQTHTHTHAYTRAQFEQSGEDSTEGSGVIIIITMVTGHTVMQAGKMPLNTSVIHGLRLFM